MAHQTKRIKILFTIPNFDTAGSGKAMLKVAKGLNTNLFDAQICCLHDRGVFFNEVKKSGLPIYIVQYTTKMKPYYKGLKNCFKISRKFREINPDIIHSFHYAPDYSEALAAKLAGIKWIYTKKNMNWGGKSKNGWKLRSFLASAIVAQNTDMIKRFFNKKKNVYLIPRGVDTNEFVPEIKSESLQKEWGLTGADRILVCVANLVPVKGIEVLINAFSNCINTDIGINLKLLIVGDNQNAYGETLKNLSKDLKLSERVIFTGKQYNIKEYLSLAEAFVLPTLNKGRMEGSPVSLLEAMACEKNVFASNIPGIKDQLKDFSAHLVKAGDVLAWEKAINQIFINSTTKNKELGKLFRTHIINNFKIEHEVAKCEKLYLQLV